MAALTGDDWWGVWGKQGGDCLLEIGGCCSQGSDWEGVSSSSDGLCISILDVDKCKEWRKEDNISGEKKIQGLKKASDVTTCKHL